MLRRELLTAEMIDPGTSERLHWEGAVDLAPETVAQRMGDRFRR
jgi:hypothetical protein